MINVTTNVFVPLQNETFRFIASLKAPASAVRHCEKKKRKNKI